MHITIPVLLFLKFSVFLGNVPKASCGKYFLITKAIFLGKCASPLDLGIFNISETNRIKDNTVSIRYISINFYGKFNRRKVIIHNSLQVPNGENKKGMKGTSRFQWLWLQTVIILLFTIADNLKEEPVLRTTTVVLTKKGF